MQQKNNGGIFNSARRNDSIVLFVNVFLCFNVIYFALRLIPV